MKGRGGVNAPQVFVLMLLPELLGQPALADARLANNRDQAALSGSGLAHVGGEQLDLGIASHQAEFAFLASAAGRGHAGLGTQRNVCLHGLGLSLMAMGLVASNSKACRARRKVLSPTRILPGSASCSRREARFTVLPMSVNCLRAEEPTSPAMTLPVLMPIRIAMARPVRRFTSSPYAVSACCISSAACMPDGRPRGLVGHRIVAMMASPRSCRRAAVFNDGLAQLLEQRFN